MKQWFISHPSSGHENTPVFYSAINDFAAEHSKVKMILPHGRDQKIHHTKEDIESSDLIVAEVSIPSTGSGIELGWANAAGKPIIAFHQGTQVISPSVQFVATADRKSVV